MGDKVPLVHHGIMQLMQTCRDSENSGRIFCKTRYEAFYLEIPQEFNLIRIIR